MGNSILTLYPQSDVCWLCKRNFKSKEKLSTITSQALFKTLEKYVKKWTALEKGRSSFQNFHFILNKCNAISAESLEIETLKCHPQCLRGFTNNSN